MITANEIRAMSPEEHAELKRQLVRNFWKSPIMKIMAAKWALLILLKIAAKRSKTK